MRFFTIAAFVAGAALAIPAPATEENGLERRFLPAEPITINDISYGGNGCPQGSIGANIGGGGTLMSIAYDKFIAQSGPGLSMSDHTKFCQLTLDIHVPQGVQFSIMQTDFRGYCAIPKGLSAYQKATYYFTGQTNDVTYQSKFIGPVNKDYLFSDNVGIGSAVWSPCGKSALLNIKSRVGIEPLTSNKKGLITTDSTDLKFTQIFHLKWQKCT